MSSIIKRLENISTLGEFESLVTELQQTKDNIRVSYRKGVKLTLHGHSGNLTLTSLIVRLNVLYKENLNILQQDHVKRILLTIDLIDKQAIEAEGKASSATRKYLKLKRYFVRLSFNRTHVIDRIRKSVTQILKIFQNSKFHGTVFSTLFVMGKLQGTDRHSLIPFGNLAEKKIPCFAGECFKGINLTGGCNRKGTSWTKYLSLAKDYAMGDFSFSFGGSRFTIKRSRDIIQEYLEEFKKYINRPEGEYYYFHFPKDDIQWPRILLSVQRLRVLNDEEFQKELADDLVIFLKEIIIYNNQDRVKNNDEYKDYYEFKSDQNIEYANILIKTITDPIEHPLVTCQEEREAAQDMTPIVLVSPLTEDELDGTEYIIKRPLKLGKDIPVIATSNKDDLEKVKKYVKDQALTEKVSVVSFWELKNLLGIQF